MNSVTFRQWAVGGVFQYHLNFDEITPQCLELIGEPIANEYYEQFSLKAIESNCRWSYTFTPPEVCTPAPPTETGASSTETGAVTCVPPPETMFVTFEFIVQPEKEPEHQGKLIELNFYDFAMPIDLAADEFVTVRLEETPAMALQWEAPTKEEWLCV
jgi:hypothetical protein